ncbi:DUF2599 domain-containing protein [Isoptericola sp. NPDC056578]|uniref:DUF2599 domain-containing protein n=1 Tax=Isoptericola sp. NPDC056578 TaxID=3345870 RepID=UPI00367CB60A
MHSLLRSRALPGLTALVTLLALGACSPSTPAPTETPSTVTTPGPTATPEQPLRIEVTAGDVTLEVSVPGAALDDPPVHVTPDPRAGTSTVTLERSMVDDADDTDDPVTLALASGGAFETRADGSVAVRAGGTTVGGLSAPRGARLVAADDTHLEVRPLADGASGPEDDDVTTTLGTTAVEGTDWGDREGGPSLAVVPTDWAREAGQAGTDLVWAELVTADPDVDTATMHDQLECHAIGAPDKDSWNLEPWRPDVGLVATMAARCNPTS